MTTTEQNDPADSDLSPNEVSVWDPLVRIFHWVLAGAFFIAYITEEDFLTIHSWAGYTVLGLLIFRVIWGLIGTKHARFKDFVFSPQQIIQFLKDTFFLRAKRYLGHNPAGGAMVILLMSSLLITSFSGLILFGAEEGQGPLASWLSGSSHFVGDIVEELHEFFANFTLFLVFVHVAGVLVESMIHRENLVTSMLNGKKRSNDIQE